MGYTTDFIGEFKLNKPLDAKTKKFLQQFHDTRRMARDVPSKYGVEGEFYVSGKGDFGQDQDANIINYNVPPRTQPSLWCQWQPNSDGTKIEWDGGEKFYNYVEWIKYIIDNFLEPKGYKLSGEVEWQGEDNTDVGVIVIKNNKISIKLGVVETIFNEISYVQYMKLRSRY